MHTSKNSSDTAIPLITPDYGENIKGMLRKESRINFTVETTLDTCTVENSLHIE